MSELRTLVSLVLAGFFALVWVLVLRPTMLDGPTNYITVDGPSMEPLLYTGDLVLTRKQPSYEVGDVVAFHVPESEQGEGTVVIHRIIAGDGINGYVTQGDNKDAPDQWRPVDSDVLGRQWLHVSGAGEYLSRFREPVVMGAVLLLLLALGSGVRGAHRRPLSRTAVFVVRS